MNNRHTPEPTSASLPEGCCKFSKKEYEDIRNDFKGHDFTWIPLYEAIAPKLLCYKNDRRALVEGLYKQASLHEESLLSHNLARYEEQLADKTTIPMTDICPFSVLATFTLETLDENKKPVARAVRDFFGVTVSLPSSFPGVPTLLPRFPHFYERNKSDRGEGDIDTLWNVFEASAAYAKEETDATRSDFAKAYDEATWVKKTRRNLTIGLFWSNPTRFLTLDKNSVEYIEGTLGISIPRAKHKDVAHSQGYLDTMRKLQICFQDPDCPFKSFPELSRAARM